MERRRNSCASDPPGVPQRSRRKRRSRNLNQTSKRGAKVECQDVCVAEEMAFGAGVWGSEREKEKRGEQSLEKTLEFRNPHKTLGSISVFHSRADVPVRACMAAYVLMVQKHCYTTRSRTEVQQEFLGLNAAGWHPCLFYCSTSHLPIKFRASHIDLLVSSHSYLPPLVSVKTSVARRFVPLFALTSCFVCNWHVFAFLALVGRQHGMATPVHQLGFSVLKWMAAGELPFHRWLQGVYKCVCVYRAFISARLPDSKRLSGQAMNTECDRAYANKRDSECTVAPYLKPSRPTAPTWSTPTLFLHFKCTTSLRSVAPCWEIKTVCFDMSSTCKR